MSFRWTDDAIEYLKFLSRVGYSTVDIAQRLGCIPNTVRDKQVALGLVKRLVKKHWTAAELSQLRALYPDTDSRELAAGFGCTVYQVYGQVNRMGLSKSAEFISDQARKRLAPAGMKSRYPKGHAPANKGLRRPGYAPGRMAETQFKPGVRKGVAERNWRPIGTILADPEGYLRIKVRDGRKGEPYGFGNVNIWPLLQRHVWSQHHGPIPSGHTVVFKDGNRSNCAIENLELISRAELMARNTIHNLPKPLKEVIRLNATLNRTIRRIHGEEHNDGSAKPPVRDAGSVEGRRQSYGD